LPIQVLAEGYSKALSFFSGSGQEKLKSVLVRLESPPEILSQSDGRLAGCCSQLPELYESGGHVPIFLLLKIEDPPFSPWLHSFRPPSEKKLKNGL